MISSSSSSSMSGNGLDAQASVETMHCLNQQTTNLSKAFILHIAMWNMFPVHSCLAACHVWKQTSHGHGLGGSVGGAVGGSVGAFVGGFVGASVGFFVGASVGFFVGASVGVIVGAAVGFLVGAPVGGAPVGSSAGAAKAANASVATNRILNRPAMLSWRSLNKLKLLNYKLPPC